MYVLYPAGPSYTRVHEVKLPIKAVHERLIKHLGFEDGSWKEPFGAGRGIEIAKHKEMLILMLSENSNLPGYIAVVPRMEWQHLLWSHASGSAQQWTELELHALTGLRSWPAIVTRSSEWLSLVNADVEDAMSENFDPAPPQMPVMDHHVLDVPSAFFSDTSGAWGESCAI